jgi:hypothetical protein
MGCGYIDLLDGKKWKESGCGFVLSISSFEESFTMTSANTGGSCFAEGNFQTYIYGGPANVPELIWSALGPTRLDCNVTFNGTRPDRLLGPTWVKLRVGIDKAETGSDDRHGNPVYAEVYAPIDGDLREIPLEIDIRFADNRTDDTVEIDEEFDLVVELEGSEFFEGATDIELDAFVSNSEAVSVLVAPQIPGPFSVAGGASRSFVWSLKALEKGVFTLSASGRGKAGSGNFFSFRANLPVRILNSEFDVEVTATPTPFKINETLSTELGERCQEYNQTLVDQNREDEQIANCIQIDVKVTNDDDQAIENVNMLHKDDITEAIDVLTESTDIEENKVPLIQIDYLTPVDDNGEELFDPIKLEPQESATFTWLVEAEAESNPLEIRPVVLGSIDNANVQGSGVGELEIKENLLLKFGAKLKYPSFTPFSGAPIRLEGFLENHSTENWISATVIAYPEDNAGRGVLFDEASDYRPGVQTDSRSCRRFAEVEADGLPDFLQVFMIPPAEAEDEPFRINLEGVLATLCWDENSEATVSYIVRSYTLQTDSDGKLVTDSQGNAIKLDEISEQTKIEDKEGYNDTFRVALRANPDVPVDEVTSDCQYVLWGFHLGCEGARGVYAFGYGLAIEFPAFLFEVGKQDLYYGARLAHWTADQWANMYRAFFNEDADAYAKLIAEAKLVTESFVRAAVITADQQEALVVAAVDEL